MGWQTLREAVPTVVMHMTAAAVHLMAITAIGATLGPAYTALVAALLLVAPATAVLAILAGHRWLGALLFGLSFVGTAGLTLFGHLGLGFLETAFHAASSPWKTLFFATSMLLPLLQVTGILEAARVLLPERITSPRLAGK
ncbi:MAG: hypothetical protein ACOY94_10255 [Bacillota bacterium]